MECELGVGGKISVGCKLYLKSTDGGINDEI